MSLDQRLQASAYLSDLLRQTTVPQVVSSPDMAETVLLDVIARINNQSDFSSISEDLRRAKIDFSLAWSVADLTGSLSFNRLGRLQSEFADATIATALRAAWHAPAIVKLTRDLPAPSETVPGLFILGLGKLGGNDLNFSSDIDLIGYFDPGKVPVASMQGKSDVCSRVLKEFTRLLSDQTHLGFVWRVDWRLRPDASVNPLALSAEMAEEYYFFRSLPWHRLALLKARVVGGDLSCGQIFLDRLEPYIWRVNLDFRAIDELAILKQKINNEHPRLRQQRAQKEPITDLAAGVNLKLGAGCIREVEFIANALQLIWGGKKPKLRVTRTLDALDELKHLGLLPASLCDQLIEAYCYFRKAENRLQMISNSQVYEVPSGADAQKSYLRLLGEASWSQFEHDLKSYRLIVSSYFESMFNEVEKSQENQVVEWPESLSELSQRIIAGWEEGFLIYGASRSQATMLRQLVPNLESRIVQSGLPIDLALERVDKFLRRLPPGGQYLRLLLESPRLLDGLIPPLLYSPLMTRILEQSPHIIDRLMESNPVAEEVGIDDQADFILHVRDQETRLERIRKVLNEELYRICLDFIQGRINSRRFEQLHTILAEKMLTIAIQITCDELGLSESPIAILGMGKLGMAAMAPESDIDLVFICADSSKLDIANRFASKLQTVVSAKMREGRVFELDTRLRPSGRSGPPTISVESFRNYQMNQARTWEHLALFPARVVCGNAQVGEQVKKIRSEVLTRPRDSQQMINDAMRMLWRLKEEKIRPVEADSLQIKLRPGGLMETEYLFSIFGLQLSAQNPTLVNLPYQQAIHEIAQSHSNNLDEILLNWRSLQLWFRLLGLESKRFEDIVPAIEYKILQDLQLESLTDIKIQCESMSRIILTQLDELNSQASIQSETCDDWQESAVHWTDSQGR